MIREGEGARGGCSRPCARALVVVCVMACMACLAPAASARAASGASRTVGIAAVGIKGSVRASARGDVVALGARFRGSPRIDGISLSSPVVGIAGLRHGYLLATAQGNVYAFGPPFRGSPRARGIHLPSPVVGIAASGRGYLLATAAGGVYAFGARFRGSLRSLGIRPSSRIVGIAASGRGYLLATARGGVYAFGARFHGSPRSHGVRLSSPVVGIAAAGRGYLLATAKGTLYGYGPGYVRTRRLRLKARVAGIAATSNDRYMVATAAGRAFTYLGAGRTLGATQTSCAQPLPPLPASPASGLTTGRGLRAAQGGPGLGLSFGQGAKFVLKFLAEGAVDWGLDEGLSGGLGWVLNSLGFESKSPQIDPAVVAEQFADVNTKLGALGQQQYQDCLAVQDAVDRVVGTQLQASYDELAQPVVDLIAQVQTYQTDFNMIAEKLIENGGNVDALSPRYKQDMVDMTGGGQEGIPAIVRRIDDHEGTALEGANSVIGAYNRVLLHILGYGDDGSDSPFKTHIFPSAFVNAAYGQQDAIAAVVAEAAYLYTNVEHLTFTFQDNTYSPEANDITQFLNDAQKDIQSWSSAFSGNWVSQGKPQGIGILPDATVLDYRNQRSPVLWTDGSVALNGDDAKAVPLYCATPTPFCYADQYDDTMRGSPPITPHSVGATALVQPSTTALAGMIAAQSGDPTATGWQSLSGWRIPTGTDWNALQAGATGGLSAWDAANHMHIFAAKEIESYAAGGGAPIATVGPFLVNTGDAGSPTYGLLNSSQPSANALTLEPRPFPADRENDLAGRLVLAQDFTPQGATTLVSARARKHRLYGRRPNGHRRRHRSHPKLGLPAPVSYKLPTACSQPDVYTVPDGVASVEINASGGGGAQGARLSSVASQFSTYSAGGRGGVVDETIPAVAGSKLYVQVGGAGSLPTLTQTSGVGGAGGVGGGGAGGSSQDGKNGAVIPVHSPQSGGHSGGGGGASGVTSTANCSRWLVVGGGGGGGGAGFINFWSSGSTNFIENGGQGGSGCPLGGGPGCASTDAQHVNPVTYGRLGQGGGSHEGGQVGGGPGATMQGGGGGGAQFDKDNKQPAGGGGGGAGGGYYGGGGGGGGGDLTGGGGGGGGGSFAIPGPSSGTPSYGFGAGSPVGVQLVPAVDGSVTITPVMKHLAPLTISASSTQTAWGQPPSLIAKVPADATGRVGFYDDINGGCEYSKQPGAKCQGLGGGQIMQGVATIPAPSPALGVGSHSLHASYDGDARYAANDSANVVVNVGKGDPAMNLQISGTARSPGQSIKSIAVVMAADATGSVTFSARSVDGTMTPLGSAPIKNGSAILEDLQATQHLAPGANQIRASFTGDARYAAGNSNPVTVTVTK